VDKFKPRLFETLGKNLRLRFQMRYFLNYKKDGFVLFLEDLGVSAAFIKKWKKWDEES